MARRPARPAPSTPGIYRASVVRSERVSPSFHRVTVSGPELDGFDAMGYDQWFRLFLQLPHQPELRLPTSTSAAWWPQHLAVPERHRPHLSNYTVAGYRQARDADSHAELDIDFVVHRGPDGELEGGAAIWACAARPGDAVGLLDQGCLFDCPDDASDVVVVADESGLPAVEGIVRSLPRDAVGTVIVEVPAADDRRELATPPGVDVNWVVRDDPHAVPGGRALAELRRRVVAGPSTYAFVVGESGLATGGRRHLHGLGVPKDRITFSGFWRRRVERAGRAS
jgi:NADPH-dependent ferric siderophore reductase